MVGWGPPSGGPRPSGYLDWTERTGLIERLRVSFVSSGADETRLVARGIEEALLSRGYVPSYQSLAHTLGDGREHVECNFESMRPRGRNFLEPAVAA